MLRFVVSINSLPFDPLIVRRLRLIASQRPFIAP